MEQGVCGWENGGGGASRTTLRGSMVVEWRCGVTGLCGRGGGEAGSVPHTRAADLGRWGEGWLWAGCPSGSLVGAGEVLWPPEPCSQCPKDSLDVFCCVLVSARYREGGGGGRGPWRWSQQCREQCRARHLPPPHLLPSSCHPAACMLLPHGRARAFTPPPHTHTHARRTCSPPCCMTSSRSPGWMWASSVFRTYCTSST